MNYDPLLSLSSLGHYHLNVLLMKMRENTHIWEHGQVKSLENYIGEIVERELEKGYRMSYFQIFLRIRGKKPTQGLYFQNFFNTGLTRQYEGQEIGKSKNELGRKAKNK